MLFKGCSGQNVEKWEGIAINKQLIIDILDAVEYKYMSTDWSLEKVIKWAKEGLEDAGDSSSYKED